MKQLSVQHQLQVGRRQLTTTAEQLAGAGALVSAQSASVMRGDLRTAGSPYAVLGLHVDLQSVNAPLMPNHVVGTREDPIAARKAARVFSLVIRLLQHDPLHLRTQVVTAAAATVRGQRADRETATIYKVH